MEGEISVGVIGDFDPETESLLGTCGGFQHVVIEYARNVLGFADAQHAEYDPGSRTAGLYGESEASERYYCDFGLDPKRKRLLVPQPSSSPASPHPPITAYLRALPGAA
jgi:CTP synthase (UTP-ammonia lyase)